MLLRTTTTTFLRALPILEKVWPPTTNPLLAKAIKLLKTPTVASVAEPLITLNTNLSKEELVAAAAKLAAMYSTPSKYEKFFGLGGDRSVGKKTLNATALKLRPGAQVGLILEGYKTTARLNSLRRTEFQGSPNWLKSEMLIDVSKIPLFLEQESKCDCKYCGTKPKGDDIDCRKCGAPLPSC